MLTRLLIILMLLLVLTSCSSSSKAPYEPEEAIYEVAFASNLYRTSTVTFVGKTDPRDFNEYLLIGYYIKEDDKWTWQDSEIKVFDQSTMSVTNLKTGKVEMSMGKKVGGR